MPDLPAFLRTIAPVLEKRLAESTFAGHTGELRISFYRGGLRMSFENGALTGVEDWMPGIGAGQDEGMAGFPYLTFLHLVFGHRTLKDLRHAFVDCWAEDAAQALLEAGSYNPRDRSGEWRNDGWTGRAA